MGPQSICLMLPRITETLLFSTALPRVQLWTNWFIVHFFKDMLEWEKRDTWAFAWGPKPISLYSKSGLSSWWPQGANVQYVDSCLAIAPLIAFDAAVARVSKLPSLLSFHFLSPLLGRVWSCRRGPGCPCCTCCKEGLGYSHCAQGGGVTELPNLHAVADTHKAHLGCLFESCWRLGEILDGWKRANKYGAQL